MGFSLCYDHSGLQLRGVLGSFAALGSSGGDYG